MQALKNQPSSQTSGVLLVLGSCISLQVGAALAIQLFPQIGVWGVTTLRLALAGLILCALTRPQPWRWNQQQWVSVLLLGLAFAGMNGAFYQSLALLPLGLAVAVEFIGPLALAALLSRRLLDALWIGLAALGMGLIGLEKASGSADISSLGLVFALIAGFFWACYILASSHVGKLLPGTEGLGPSLLCAAVLTLPFGTDGTLQALGDPQLLALALGAALLASVLPYSLEMLALRRLPKKVFSILLSLEPGIAALGGWLLLAQPTGPLRWVAIALLTLASIGITLTSRPRSRAKAREVSGQG